MKPYYSLSDFPDRKNAGKNFIARCPKCGTMHLYISKAKGLYHCFYAGCDFNGILTDYCKDNRPMFPYKKGDSPSNTGTYRPQDSRNAENSVNEVPMLPVGRTPLPGRPGHLPHHRHCGTHRLSAPLLHHQKQ